MLCSFLLYNKVTQSHLRVFFLIFFSTLVCHRLLNIVPCILVSLSAVLTAFRGFASLDPTHVTLSAVCGVTGACPPCDCWAWPGLKSVLSQGAGPALGAESPGERSQPLLQGLWAPCPFVPTFGRSSLVCPQVSSGDLKMAPAHIFSHPFSSSLKMIVPSPRLLLCCFQPQVCSLPGSLAPGQPSVRHARSEPRRPPAGGSLLRRSSACGCRRCAW